MENVVQRQLCKSPERFWLHARKMGDSTCGYASLSIQRSFCNCLLPRPNLDCSEEKRARPLQGGLFLCAGVDNHRCLNPLRRVGQKKAHIVYAVNVQRSQHQGGEDLFTAGKSLALGFFLGGGKEEKFLCTVVADGDPLSYPKTKAQEPWYHGPLQTVPSLPGLPKHFLTEKPIVYNRTPLFSLSLCTQSKRQLQP